MDWKFLGEKEVLGAFHSDNFPVKWAEGAADWAFDDEWEKRKVYVVEGVSKLPQYAYSKRVLYIDKEIYAIPYTDMYDRAGELWKIWINNFTFRKEAFPGSHDEVRRGHAVPPLRSSWSTCSSSTPPRPSLPSHRFPGEPGWYWSPGRQGRHHRGPVHHRRADRLRTCQCRMCASRGDAHS